MFINIWFILIYWQLCHEQKRSFIHLESISLNAMQLSTLMFVKGNGKINFRSHFNIL